MSAPAPASKGVATREVRFGSPQLERAARSCFVAAVALGAFALALQLLAPRLGLDPRLLHAKPRSAVCLILLGGALWVRRSPGGYPRARKLLSAAAIAVALTVTVLALRDGAQRLGTGMSPTLQTLTLATPMPPFSALNVALLGLAALLINGPTRALVLNLAALPLLLSLSSLVGYLYGGDPLRDHRVLPPIVALSALGFALLAIGVICTRLRPETGALLSGRDDAARATRRLLLGLVAIPIGIGALELSLRPLGLYDIQLGTALLVVTNVLLLVSLSLWHMHEAQRGLRREAALQRELDHKEAELSAEARMHSERVRGQRALEQSEEKFRTLAVHAPVAIFEATPAGDCTFVNRKWLELTERTLEEALGGGWKAALHPDDRERVERWWGEVTAGGRPLVAEYRFLSKSGKVSWMQSSAVPLRDASGAITGYLGTLVDETERKQTIDALAKSETNFRALVEHAPFGVVVFRAGMVVYTNATYAKLLGYDSAELVGKPLIELVADSMREVVRQRLHDMDLSGAASVPPVPVLCRRKDGEEVLLEGTSATLSFNGADAVVTVVRDVTEQQRVEHVRILAERALRESLREKEVLLKEIHHRVKNNLQVIVSLINLQASKIDDDVTRAAFDETRARVHAIALLHERLYRSKNLGRIDMRDYLHGLASDLSSTAQLRHVEMRVTAEEVYWEMDSAVPIGLIVNELVTNAYKHAFPPDRASGHIQIALTRRDGECVVTVSDDGVGYPPDFEEHDSLGLLLITSLSRQLGGGVEFENRDGAHAVVTFPDPSRDGTRTSELRSA